MHRSIACLVAVSAMIVCQATGRAEELRFKQQCLRELVERVPEILKGYQPKTGRFVTGRAWDQRNNQRLYPLAVLYSRQADFNPHYRDPKLLDVIVKAGNALIDAQDDRGRWLYTKSDGSTWGWRWQEWTYSRWVDAFEMIRGEMPEKDRARWDRALCLAFTHMDRAIVDRIRSERVDNHRAEMGAGLFAAGVVLDQPEWCKHAAAYMRIVINQQSPNGYWSEGGGPVVLYDFEYIGSLARYYARSRDEAVLGALERAARFHYRFTYPNGTAVETIDQRNPFVGRINEAWEGFSMTPVGRAYLKRQWGRLDPEQTARMVVIATEGEVEPPGLLDAEHEYFMQIDGVPRAAIIRRGPWFVCLSAIVTPLAEDRWYCDRQNFVSIYHRDIGLILGGGNTKMQPHWSNFTVGDTSLLRHTPGDANPTFTPLGKLYHVPFVAECLRSPHPGLTLWYGPECCDIRVEIIDEGTLDYVVSATRNSDLPVAAHLTLLPQPKLTRLGESLVPASEETVASVGKAVLETSAGYQEPLGTEPLSLRPGQIGDWIQYCDYRLHVPKVASLHWPVLPHNPYRKGGEARIHEGRIEIRIPFDNQSRSKEYRLRFEVLRDVK
jgi:hypothetical protein